MAGMWLGVGIAVLAAAVVLIVVGWRGRRVDEHPICRRCGFDLFGVYPQRQACPECGAALDARTVRTGNRQRRPKLIAAGLALALLLAGVGGFVGYSAAVGRNWNAYKPVWLLRYDALYGVTGTPDDAFAELKARLAANELNGSDLVALYDDFFAADAERRHPFGNWTPLLISAWENGHLTDEQMLRAAKHWVMPLRLWTENSNLDGLTVLMLSLAPPWSDDIPLHFDLTPRQEVDAEINGYKCKVTLTPCHLDNPFSAVLTLNSDDIPPDLHDADRSEIVCRLPLRLAASDHKGRVIRWDYIVRTELEELPQQDLPLLEIEPGSRFIDGVIEAEAHAFSTWTFFIRLTDESLRQFDPRLQRRGYLHADGRLWISDLIYLEARRTLVGSFSGPFNTSALDVFLVELADDLTPQRTPQRAYVFRNVPVMTREREEVWNP